MQSIVSEQIGNVNVFDSVVVEAGSENFVLQILNNNGEAPVCMRYWVDEDQVPCQGIFIPDSVELFNAKPEIIKLTKLTTIPAWMRNIYVDPIKYLTMGCTEVE